MSIIGTVARFAGIDIGKIANNVVSNLLGNSVGGKVLGSIAGGIAAFLSGDPMGALQQGLSAFKNIGQGFKLLFTPQQFMPSQFPQLPFAQTPIGLGTGVPGTNLGSLFPSGGNALGDLMRRFDSMGVGNQVRSMMADPEMRKKFTFMAIQQRLEQMKEMFQLLTNIMKAMHETNMSIIRNIR